MLYLSLQKLAACFTTSVFGVVTVLALMSCDAGQSTVPATAGRVDPVSGGGTVYAQYCNSCHPGGMAGAGPSLVIKAPRISDARLKDIVRSGKNRMPGFGENVISNSQLEDLVAYIRTLK